MHHVKRPWHPSSFSGQWEQRGAECLPSLAVSEPYRSLGCSWPQASATPGAALRLSSGEPSYRPAGDFEQESPLPLRSPRVNVQGFLHIILDTPMNVQYSLHLVLKHGPRRVGIMTRFTAGELKVMRLLWEHGELKPSELQKLFPEPIKNPALRSYLTILIDKGHVARRKVGKAFLYKSITPKRRAFSVMLGELVETFCDGSMEQLLLTLVRKEKLTQEDLDELTRVADQTDASASSSQKSRSSSKRGK